MATDVIGSGPSEGLPMGLPCPSQRRTVPSLAPLTIISPSKLKARQLMFVSCALNTRMGLPCPSHNRIIPRSLPLIMICPSGLTATVSPVPVEYEVPSGGETTEPCRLHRRTFPSEPPLTIIRPLELIATDATRPS